MHLPPQYIYRAKCQQITYKLSKCQSLRVCVLDRGTTGWGEVLRAPNMEQPPISLLWASCSPLCRDPHSCPLLEKGGDKDAPQDGVHRDTQTTSCFLSPGA